MNNRIRWKRQPRQTGLAGIGSAPPGWDLHDGETTYAWVSPLGGNWQRELAGWYWVVPEIGGMTAYQNTSGSPCSSPEEAKKQAMEYVKTCLAQGDSNHE